MDDAVVRGVTICGNAFVWSNYWPLRHRILELQTTFFYTKIRKASVYVPTV